MARALTGKDQVSPQPSAPRQVGSAWNPRKGGGAEGAAPVYGLDGVHGRKVVAAGLRWHSGAHAALCHPEQTSGDSQ